MPNVNAIGEGKSSLFTQKVNRALRLFSAWGEALALQPYQADRGLRSRVAPSFAIYCFVFLAILS